MLKRKIYFRSDGNVNIGLGHVFRCLALTEILNDYFECIFVTRFVNEYIIAEIKKSCSNYIKLSETKHKHFDEFITYLEKDDIVVLDNYFFTTEYQKQIKAIGCKLVCIDDMHDKHYVADVVINHGIGLRDEQFSIESYTKLCLGWDYALLRKPFLNVTPRERIEQKRCLVCIGGADINNITTNILKLLDKVESVEVIDVIIGSSFLFKSELEKVISNSIKKVNIFSNLSALDMVDRMQTADFGILPASTISLEATAIGMPFLVGYCADNQEQYYNNLDSLTKNIGLGNLLKLNKLGDYIFENKIIKVHNNSFNSKKIKIVFNGFNYIKRVDEISFVNYTELNRTNKEKVLKYRNQKDIRKWMTTDSKISLENHLNFINTLNKSTDKYYFAAFKNNVLIGSVSIVDCNSSSCSVGLFTAKEFTDNGVELAYFSQLYAFNFLNLKEIIIKVHVDNKNAIDFNVFLGYKLYDTESSWLNFRLLNKKINYDYQTFLKDCIKNYKLQKNEHKKFYKTFC